MTRDLFGNEIPDKPLWRGDVCPEWFVGGTATQRANVLRGLHPLSLPLGPEGSTCGECAHFKVRRMGGQYFKCELHHTGGRATDLRRKWRCCTEFAPRVADVPGQQKIPLA